VARGEPPVGLATQPHEPHASRSGSSGAGSSSDPATLCWAWAGTDSAPLQMQAALPHSPYLVVQSSGVRVGAAGGFAPG